LVEEPIKVLGGPGDLLDLLPNFADISSNCILKQHKKYSKYRGSLKMQETYDEKFRDLIKTVTVEKVTCQKLLWINPSHLVPKSNRDMRLVIDMRKVNKSMKPIKFKLEGITTLKHF
jgi:hypothetical protein